VIHDGELIGDPSEGALVALAAKGGIDTALTRETYPRVAELPFDAAYKLMATFHAMTDESGHDVIRCFVKGAPDQLLARSATVFDADTGAEPADGRFRERYLAENQRLGEQGLRVLATARKDFDPATFDPAADLLPLVADLELLALVGIVDPPRPTAKDSITTRDEWRTVFSLDTFSDRTFNLATVASVLTLILATVFGPLQKLLETHQPRRPPMAHLQLRRIVDHRGLGNPESHPAAGRRARSGRDGITHGRVTTFRDGAHSMGKPFRNERGNGPVPAHHRRSVMSAAFPGREAESADCDRPRW